MSTGCSIKQHLGLLDGPIHPRGLQPDIQGLVRGEGLARVPRRRGRLSRRARTGSGGEEEMGAMARARCGEPKVLWVDERPGGCRGG